MTKIVELRGKSPDELKEMALSLKKEMFNLRFQAASGETLNGARVRSARRDVARIKTLLNQPDYQAQPAPKAAKPAKKAKAAPAAEAAPKEAKAKKTTTKKKASGE